MAVTAAVYARVAGFEFVDFDDPVYLVENEIVREGLTLEGVRWAFTASRASNWHPLTWLSHMLDVELFGMSAGAHHLVSLAWHLLNVVLLYVFVRSATDRAAAALVVAALFALHPLNAESVAWISERKNLVSTAFGLASLIAWVRYAHGGGWKAYCTSWVALAFGLLAKPMLVTLPFVMLLADYWPLGRWTSGARASHQLVAEKGPMFALAAASSLTTYLVQRSAGAVGSMEALPFGARIGNAIVSYASYLKKIAWPTDLAILYQHPYSPGGVALPVWGLAVLLLLLAAITAAAWSTRRYGWPLTGWLWFVGTLVPVIGLVQVGQQGMADRYTYLPAIGLYLIVSFAGFELARRSPRVRAGLVAGSIVACVALAALTAAQARSWRDSVALFSRGLEVSPRNPVLHYNLGTSLEKRGDATGAARHYRLALDERPHDASVHFGLANALAASGDHEAALRHYDEAVDLDPGRFDAWFNRANSLLALGQLDGAIASYRQALDSEPGSFKARLNLALAALGASREREALESFALAAELEPGSAAPHLGSAWILATSADPAVRDPARAVALAERARALSRGDDVVALDTLGAAYASAGDFERAERAALEALRRVRAHGDPRRAAAIEERLARYRLREPWFAPLHAR